ncbi:response regulator [bacterium]|nr:response regulator [bacterium]
MESRKPTVLIAEDEPDLLDLYRQGLEMIGATVLKAEDGERAWDVFQSNADAVDLVISDIFMPGMNGVQLMNKIKDHSPKLPVFLVTGYAHLRTLVEESAYEPDAYLEKPFNLRDLFSRVKQALPPEMDLPDF